MPSLTFSTNNVYKAIQNLSNSLSSGTDKLSCFFLKKCSSVLCAPLAYLFNLSLLACVLPSQWHMANVIPILKKGNSSFVSNYRPISLTSVVCRTMECIIKDHILHFLISHNLINASQHGFLSKHSTQTQLQEVIHEWFLLNDKNIPFDCIYLDIAKAFDTVSHRLLLHKLAMYGFDHFILEWIRCFLSNRMQRVVINNCHYNINIQMLLVVYPKVVF